MRKQKIVRILLILYLYLCEICSLIANAVIIANRIQSETEQQIPTENDELKATKIQNNTNEPQIHNIEELILRTEPTEIKLPEEEIIINNFTTHSTINTPNISGGEKFNIFIVYKVVKQLN